MFKKVIIIKQNNMIIMLLCILFTLTACSNGSISKGEDLNTGTLAFAEEYGSKLDLDAGINLMKYAVIIFEEYDLYKNNDENFCKMLIENSESISNYIPQNDTETEIISGIKICVTSLLELRLRMIELFQLEGQEELNIGNISDSDVEKAKENIRTYEGYAERSIEKLYKYFEYKSE